MFTLEPAYRDAGGSATWGAWFMNNLIQHPSLAFAFTQAGQENSFGWEAMAAGFTRQLALIAAKARAGEIEVKTLAQAGQWFRSHYSVTPPTAVVALDDWKNENRKTVWYDSRFYRLNLLWQNGTFFIRDLHCFDEKVVSPTHDTALKTTFLACETLPIMDCAVWFASTVGPAGMWPVLVAPDGNYTPMTPHGPPVVTELNTTDLSIRQPLRDGAVFSMVCSETNVSFAGVDAQGRALRWACRLVGGVQQKSAVRAVGSDGVLYYGVQTDYQLRLGSGSCSELNSGDIVINPNASGVLILIPGTTARK
jgi:hypothetical protein